MTTSRKIAIAALGALLIVGGLVYGTTRFTRLGPPLTIGAILPLTGAAAAYGDEARKALEILEQEISASGGVNGRSLKFAYQDDEMNAAGAQRAYQLLLGREAVAMVGPLAGQAALAIVGNSARDKMVLISPTASTPALSGASTFFFRIWPPDGIEGDAVAKLIRQNIAATKVAILAEQTDFGKVVASVFTDKFRTLGGTILFSDQFPSDTRDFRSSIQKAVDEGAEVLYVPAYYAPTAIILQQAKAIAPQLRIVGASPSEDIKLIQLAQASAENFSFVRPKRPPPEQGTLEATFNRTFEQKFGNAPGAAARFTYDAARVLINAIRDVGNDGTTISNYLRSGMPPFIGVTGLITFDTNGDVKREFEPIVVKNGKFVSP